MELNRPAEQHNNNQNIIINNNNDNINNTNITTDTVVNGISEKCDRGTRDSRACTGITLTARHEERKCIFVSLPNHATTTMEVGADWTIGRIRHTLARTHGVGLRLIHAGKELRCDDEVLCVPSHDTIRVLLGLQGGGKAKSKGGKSFKKGKKVDTKSELIFKEDGQEYAQVLRLLGSSRLTVLCTDGKERLCTIRGKLVRRAWVSVGTIILVSLRDFEEKCDMIHKYSDEEARNLRTYNELPHTMKLVADDTDGGITSFNDNDDDIQFDFEGEIDIDAI